MAAEPKKGPNEESITKLKTTLEKRGLHYLLAEVLKREALVKHGLQHLLAGVRDAREEEGQELSEAERDRLYTAAEFGASQLTIAQASMIEDQPSPKGFEFLLSKAAAVKQQDLAETDDKERKKAITKELIDLANLTKKVLRGYR